MAKRIAVIGSINLDFVASVNRIPQVGETISACDFQTFFGGKGANQAVGISRLGHAVNVIGRVGDDHFGKLLLRGLNAARISTKNVKTVSRASSGLALITTDSKGQNTIVVSPGANAKLLPKDVKRELTLIRSTSLILTQLEIPLSTVEYIATVAHRYDIPLMLDPAPALELPDTILRCVDWLTPNETEACILCGMNPQSLDRANASQCADKLLGCGPRNVIIKMGSRGAYLAGKNGPRVFIPAFKVQAVDSTAAGDAFNAGLAVALMQGKDPPVAARFASAVAALSVTRMGAQASMPTARQISRFLSMPQ